jgi:DNA-binding transcriptional ArsR family regulator
MTPLFVSSPGQNRGTLGAIAGKFRALSGPAPLAILQELKSGRKTINGLVEVTGASRPNTSEQLNVLSGAGFISRELNGAFSLLKLCDVVRERLDQRPHATIPHYAV